MRGEPGVLFVKFRKRWAAAVALAVCAAVVPVLAQQAAAATPAWEPDPNSNGTITFFNSAGAVITSGTSLSHLFAYAEASSAEDPSGFHKASIEFAFPDHTKANTADWFVQPVSASTTYPNVSAPAPVNTFTNPVVTPGPTDVNLTGALGAGVLDTTAGYANIMQIRLVQSGGTNYWASDISFDKTAGTWTQVFPTPVAGPTTTTTALTVTPASPQQAGTTVTLKATVSPSTAAGSVQFKDGSANLGSAVTVSGGIAQLPTSSLGVGPHSITAVFTPTNASAFTTSTSSAASYTISPAPTTTTTSLGITPASPVVSGTVSTLTATLSPPTATGSVQFKDGATNINGPVTVTSGTAQTMTTFALNTHQVTAVFTPTDAAAYTASTTAAVAYTVTATPPTTTTTGLGITPAGPQPFGTALTFTGTVSPSTATGSVQFLDGTTVVTSGLVSGGLATATANTLSAGAHSITAHFVPTGNFASSTSAASSYPISQASTTTTLGVTPSSPQVQGTALTLTATISPSNLAGAVQFFDGAAPIGTPQSVTSGHATLGWSALGLGGHTLKATFEPVSTNYAGSTSSDLSYTITKPPPAGTSTTLQVTPGGPVGPNTVETLRATLTPSTAVGSVQFVDGTTNIGSPVTVSGASAQTTTTLGVGPHNLQAVFTPTDSTSFNASQSALQPYLVKPPAANTTTTMSLLPVTSAPFGSSVSLHAAVTPSGAAGTVTFKDGTTTIGSKTVSSGVADLVTLGLAGGPHSLSATFTPSAPLDFNASNSAAVAYTVTALSTTTSIATTAGPVQVGRPVKLSATVAPAAAGSVTLKNGTTIVGSAAVVAGKASLTTTSLPVGTASLTATFTPSAPNDYHGSTSEPATLQIVAAPVITSVTSNGKTVHDGDTLQPGQTLTITASGFQPDDSVEVDVQSAPTKLATVRADSSGKVIVTVTLPATLAAGSHTITLTGSVGSVAFHFLIAAAVPTGSPTTAPAAGSSGGGLANTGTDVLGGLVLAGGLAAAGALALSLGGRRRRGLHRAG